MGQIAIVSFQNATPKVIECFNVESRILCMVHIPAADPETAVGRTPVPTICVGTEEGRYVLSLGDGHPRWSMAGTAVRRWGGQQARLRGLVPVSSCA